MEGDSNLACFTYENVLVKEEPWCDAESLWLMGCKFQLPEEKDAFVEWVRSRFWFTYRKGFDAIGGTGPTSDSGWGCMLRCGQMMLAQALSILKLISKHPNWKWRPYELQNEKYYEILRCFSDDRSSCYSIHQIAQMGVQEGKGVGEWFGPNTIAQVLKKLAAFDDCNEIAIYVAMDNTVSRRDVNELCNPYFSKVGSSTCSVSDASKPQIWKPLLLVVPLRLGLSEMNPLYFDNIKRVFEWKESVGIIGGKPNHAYYFIGCSDDDSLVFLDPHTTQQKVTWRDNILDFSFDHSYHCDSPTKMPISQLDPSLALGFLCASQNDFEAFCSKVKEQERVSKSGIALFSVVESLPTCKLVESRIVSVSVHNRDKKRNGDLDADDSACLTLDSDEDLDDIDEEFEILEVQ